MSESKQTESETSVSSNILWPWTTGSFAIGLLLHALSLI